MGGHIRNSNIPGFYDTKRSYLKKVFGMAVLLLFFVEIFIEAAKAGGGMYVQKSKKGLDETS